MFALDHVEPANAAADVHAYSGGILFRHLKPGHPHGFHAGGKRQMDEAAHLLDLFLLDEVERIEALHLGGDGAGKAGGIKVRDGVHAAFAGKQVLPCFRNGVADSADHSQPGDYNPPGRPICNAQGYLPPLECLSMYSTASFTVRIFSASSSGISMSNASSNAITNSTVSSESAPRSSTNDAFDVTSPSSTPNCSTMICLTLSSTPAIDCAFLKLGVLLLHRLGMVLDVIDRVLHRLDGFGLVIRDLEVEGLFKSHDELHPVERIGAQVIDEGGASRDLAGLHAQLIVDDLPDLFLNIRHSYSAS